MSLPSVRIKLLAIDDDPQSLELVSEALSDGGLNILTAGDPETGLDLVRREHPAIVVSDVVMPKMNGMELLGHILEVDPATDVILMTAHYSTDAAVEAIKKGACDYLTKPLSLPVLRERIGKLAADARRRQRASQLDSELMDTYQFEGMVGRSPLMWEMFAQIRRIAPHYRSCAVTGPTGTGKELVAHALHKLSQASGPMVVCNCSAVVETLFESELFGHVKGAFTGADSNKMGLFEYAHGGTLFLDEIGDMPLSTQAKLLRVLQNREVQRVGSLTARPVDVRVVAATNHDLRTQIAEKRFREDLYYRLSMVEIQTPALADRKEDLPLLERFFIQKYAAQYKKPVESITPRAQILLARHSWPGNVRELENVIGHACMLTAGEVIDVADLPPYLRQRGISVAAPAVQLPGAGEELSFDEQERRVIEQALDRTGGNQVHAARMLGITRDKLRYKIKKHNLR
ncbi:MAG TPA: sigma-54 dependent transcriptional regulator [Bryobacteraceae bacterium]|nr:sigma-54 dependent transcriptional regulator [Bryobacteraceae bacterium]